MRAWSTPAGRDDSFALRLSVRALDAEEADGAEEGGDAERVPGHEVVATGALGALTIHQLRACLDDLLGEGCRMLVVDLNALTFVDASALGLLVRTRARLVEAGGELRLLYRDNPHLVSLLRLTRLDAVFG